MKKKLFLLPCIAAVAIATFVGAKTFKSNAIESDDLLMANVEALSQEEGGSWFKVKSRTTSTCEYSIWAGGKSSIKLKITGKDVIELKPGLDGWARYTISNGEVNCSGLGDFLCQPRNCPTSFWN